MPASLEKFTVFAHGEFPPILLDSSQPIEVGPNRQIWTVPETISKLSEMVALAAGDIIMTGTPSGVAAAVPGDTLECQVEGVGKLTVTIGPPAN